MWNLTPNDLAQLKGAGGERFAQFMDRLIRADAARAGVGQSKIATQLRANIKDGGVDSQVDAPFPANSDPSGWFSVPTIWQYKATDAVSVSESALREEINKPYAKKLILKGFGYRFCILGDVTPEKTFEDWENILLEEAVKIRPDAAEPRVVGGGHILNWAERFPAMVAALRNVGFKVLHWETWLKNCRAVTQHYVANPEWAGVRQQILQHADFNAPCVGNDPCLVIGGAAGVGKTRLVFETLSELQAAPALVLYADDESDARAAAATIVNRDDQSVIVVADECSLATRHVLNEMLRGHSDRVRVFSLDNIADRPATGESRQWLSASSLEQTCDVILERNFPDVPPDRRHQYVQLSKGFVRFAAAMCQDSELIQGNMAGLLLQTKDYVKRCLDRRHHALLGQISLIALFHKVGFRDDVSAELQSLCTLANMTPQQFKDAVRMVRESPGFVVQAGRFWYVTPEIVARVLFAEGWERWVASDPQNFLDQVHPILQQQLIERASTLGETEVRAQLSGFFRKWFAELNGERLANARNSSLAAALIETAPNEYLPFLRAIIQAASPAELQNIQGHALGEKWGPRRTLVWLLERLVAFPEFFDDCEACLFRLALHESEPQIGNNATIIWQSLFSVYLSGTAIPFANRINALRAHANATDANVLALAFSGFATIFRRPTGRIVGRPVVAGRLRPNHWAPATLDEEVECYRTALRACADYISGSDTHLHDLAFDVVVDSVYFLLAKDLIDDLAETLPRDRLTEREVIRLLHAVDRYLEAQENLGLSKSDSRVAEKVQRVTEWIQVFRPSDFDGRLRSVCSREPWDGRFSSDPLSNPDEITGLAKEILADTSRLQRHLDWLGSREAQSAERLGFSIGGLDEELNCARMIAEQAIAHGIAPILRGYVRGLVFRDGRPSDEMIALIDELSAKRPEMAADIICFGGDAFDAVDRIIRLVDEKAIPARFLAILAMGVGRRELTLGEVERLIPYFVGAATAGDAESARAGVRFLARYVWQRKRESQNPILASATLQEMAWGLVIAALPFVNGNTSSEWVEIVERLSDCNPERAADVLGQAMLRDGHELSQVVEEKLVEMASRFPDAVMNGFGRALLDQENGWRFQIGVQRDLVAMLPSKTVSSWVQKHGIAAARAIARHLPPPSIDANGNPVVPELLDTVLREFDDDEVFNNFLMGCHSGDTWWGNGSEQFHQEAETAKAFLSHSNPRIREWAKHEIAERLWMAEHEEREHAERFLPS